MVSLASRVIFSEAAWTAEDLIRVSVPGDDGLGLVDLRGV